LTQTTAYEQIFPFKKGYSVNLNIFSELFSSIEDSRESLRVTYPLFDVFFLTAGAVIAAVRVEKILKTLVKAGCHGC